MATNFLRFCRADSVNGVAFPVGASGVGCAACRIYTGSGQERAGVNYALGVLPLLPLHCLPYSTMGGFLLSSPMDKHKHKYMRIQITSAVDTAPPWCHSSTLLLDFLPLDEHVADWQALKLKTASCQISDQFHFAGCQFYDPFHFEAHLIFGSGRSPQYEFFDLIGN